MAGPRLDTQEREPLLAPRDGAPVADANRQPANKTGGSYLRVLIIGYTLITLGQLHAGIFNTALKQLVEGLLCRQYHDDVLDPTRDPRCKGERTQAELSLIFSLESTFEMVPSLLLSIPYGIMADIYGRRFVAFLSILGCLVYPVADAFVCWKSDVISLRWLWAVPVITTFVGGGAPVYPVMIYTMITDVAPKYKRAGAFMIMHTAPVFGGVLSGPATYWLMKKGEWTAILVSIIILAPSSLIVFLTPETLHLKTKEDGEEDSDESREAPTSVATGIQEKLSYFAQTASTSFREIFIGNPKLCLLLLSSLTLETGRFIAATILQQYITKRYPVDWKETQLWFSIKSVLQMVTGLALLPILSQLMTKSGMSAATKDAWIARVGLLLVIGSYFIIGVAEKFGVFLFGNVLTALSLGVEPAMRSLMVIISDKAGVGALFAMLQVVGVVGIMISGPLAALLFRTGLRWGDKWLGLPFLLAAAVVVPTAIVMFTMRFDDKQKRRTSEETEDAEN